MNNELYHYGVPGMKWGVIRAKKQEARSNYKKAKREIDDRYKKAAQDNWDGKLSDAKFEKAADNWAVERKQAKADYKQAKQEIKQKIETKKAKGKKAAEIALGVVGGVAITAIIASPPVQLTLAAVRAGIRMAKA